MNRREFNRTLLAGASILPSQSFGARPRFKKPENIESKHFEVVRLSESVFSVSGKPDTGIPSNSAIIVGDRAVAVVDTHLLPSLDVEVIGIVRQITDLPIEYLVNSHWHQDHTLGNQAFAGRVKAIVGHANTRLALLNRVVSNVELQRQLLPEQIAHARESLDLAKQGGTLKSEDLRRLTRQVELDEEFLKELNQIRVVPPNITFEQTHILDIGSQPVELRHMGLGHTQGDIVVHLPREKTIVLGDLVTSGQPFMRRQDAVPSQWAPTLRRIAGLAWDQGVIGHGRVSNVRERLEIEAQYLEALVLRVRQAVDAGVPAGEVEKAVLPGLMEFAPHFPYFEQAAGENILRTYEELHPNR